MRDEFNNFRNNRLENNNRIDNHNRSDSNNRSDNNSKNIVSDFDSNESKSKSNINHSGNSDVDVNVNVTVDTTSIAYAYLCSLLATKKMTNDEFEEAVRKMEEMTQRHKRKNDVSNVKLFDQYRDRNQNRQQHQRRRNFF